MGFSLSTSHMIFFIGALIVASSVMAIMVNVILTVSTNMENRGEDLSLRLETDVTIINDPDNMATDPLIVYVKNTGRVKLEATLDVFVDNEYMTNVTFTQLDNNSDLWQPGEVLKVTIYDVTLNAGEHTVVVATTNGITDRFTFIIQEG